MESVVGCRQDEREVARRHWGIVGEYDIRISSLTTTFIMIPSLRFSESRPIITLHTSGFITSLLDVMQALPPPNSSSYETCPDPLYHLHPTPSRHSNQPRSHLLTLPRKMSKS